ncbi:MAG: hypothetical protein Q8T08_23810, partial [Ignavibacteria bacterium]|nr:hypothetical protein [Ignavibacteria bacterium]
MRTFKTSLTLLLLVMFAISCNKTEVPDAKTGIDSLVIPDGFTFETTKEIELTVMFPGSISFAEDRSRIDVYSDKPESGGQLLMTSSVGTDGQASIQLLVPMYQERLFI